MQPGKSTPGVWELLTDGLVTRHDCVLCLARVELELRRVALELRRDAVGKGLPVKLGEDILAEG